MGSAPIAPTASRAMPAADQATSAIVLYDTALASGTRSRLGRLCQRGALLLPVANKPIVQYIMDTLARSGIRKVTFAGTDQVSCDALSMFLASGTRNAPKNMSVNVVCDASCGKSSVNLIRRVLAVDAQNDLSVALEGHVRHDDVLVVGSLFVSPSDADLSLQGQLLYHKVKRAAVTMLLSPAVADDNGEYMTREYVAVRPDGVVAAYCPAGTSKSSDIKIPQVALLSHQDDDGRGLKLRKDVTDMRVYVFNRETLSRVLEENEGLVDVQKHLIPYFVRLTAVQSARSGMFSSSMGSNVSVTGTTGVRQGIHRALDRMSSSNLSGSGGDTDRGVDGDGSLSKWRTGVHAYVQGATPSAGTMGAIGSLASSSSPPSAMMIIDSDSSYANVNRDILRYLERSEIAKGVKLGAKAAVNTSIVAGGSALGDRSSVKRSVLGPNCMIGSSAKILNSILHEGAEVGDGCQVHNSILCRGVKLEAKSSLKDCIVGPNAKVTGGNYKNEELFDE